MGENRDFRAVSSFGRLLDRRLSSTVRLLDRQVSSTFRRWNKFIALSGGVCLSRQTDDEAPRCLWQEASTSFYQSTVYDKDNITESVNLKPK